MEHDDRHLDSLSSSVIEYFNEVLIHKNCVSSTFRKYSVKNNEDVEFSCLLLRSNCDDRKSFYPIDSSCLTEEEAKKVIEVSERWRLRIAKASFEGHKLCLKLNRPHSFCTVIRSILNRKSEYGKWPSEKQSIRVTSEEVDVRDLTGYRLSVLKNAVVNLLQSGGYEVRDAGGRGIHLTTRSSSREGEGGLGLRVVCGAVVNSGTKTKETQITSEEYRRVLLKAMEANSEGKNVDGQLVHSLVDGSIKLCLLQVKSSQAVLLNLDKEHSGNSKGGPFLQYNASRLAALRRKYRERADEGLYPKMAQPEEVDFALLREPEEWALLFNFLLEYPSLIRRSAKQMASGKSNVHQMCEFLSKLCSLFSVYYRRVRILLVSYTLKVCTECKAEKEPRDHLFETIQARMLLAMSVEQVLENGFNILSIDKVEQM